MVYVVWLLFDEVLFVFKEKYLVSKLHTLHYTLYFVTENLILIFKPKIITFYYSLVSLLKLYKFDYMIYHRFTKSSNLVQITLYCYAVLRMPGQQLAYCLFVLAFKIDI